MPKFKINGKEVEAAPGTMLIKACFDNGVFVPHYCWHPGLTPAGNCRMCLVKATAPPPAPPARGLAVSCMTPVSEGLDVVTEGSDIEKARKDVLEFLLINHPLDCPICDKSGECTLQDFTYQYRGGLTRFLEPKNIRHTKDLGPNIKIWGNRCIVCTRCVRFCDEISGTGELCVVERGDRSVVDVFPSIPIDNPLSLNVVDICPVGALIDKNFLFQARVWFAQETNTVCASCSRGCNGKITALDGHIKRFSSRPNTAVNGYWMCDDGRMNVKYVDGSKRLRSGRGSAKELGAGARTILQKHGAGSVAVVASAAQSVEELHLVKKLAAALQADRVGILTRTVGAKQTFKGGFAIEPDKTPNRTFAEMAFGADAVAGGVANVVAGIRDGKVKGLVVINGIPGFEWTNDLVDAAADLEFVGVIDIEQTPFPRAHVILPAAVWAEKDGVFLNVDRRAQRIRRAVAPPPSARPEVELLQQALIELGVGERVLSAEGVFKEVARTYPEFAGLDYAKLGQAGAPLAAAMAGAPA
jgi:NADH-quinone oxidoreductase subunit G